MVTSGASECWIEVYSSCGPLKNVFGLVVSVEEQHTLVPMLCVLRAQQKRPASSALLGTTRVGQQGCPGSQHSVFCRRSFTA